MFATGGAWGGAPRGGGYNVLIRVFDGSSARYVYAGVMLGFLRVSCY